ncbi:MAG: PAS domain S-box protein, partial [Oculatellaceae cyanobacterium bins.114]|nr:PAS domain S-box protein [Oculatellaceae cyanobacterium bins.114]
MSPRQVLVLENGHVLGILTERDVVRLSAQQLPLDQLTMREVMEHPVVTLYESAFTDLIGTINLLQQYRIRHLPILNDQDQLVGLVTHESLRQISRPIDLLRLRLVSEVMTCQVICAAPDDRMLTIAQQMAEHGVGSVMIVQPSPQSESLSTPLGIVTERDIVQFQALGLNLATCLAQTVMSTPIFAVKPDDPLWVVQQIMEHRLIRRLAVTGDQGELLGIVTQTSLLQALKPIELYKLAELLEKKIVKLEAEKIQLLESRTIELEQQVEARTIALKTKAERERLVTTIATQIRSSLSLQTILDTTVEQVRQVLGCDRVNIWQFTADWQTIAVAESTDSSQSLIGKQISDTCFKQDQAEIYRQGHIRVISDIYTTELTDCHRELLIELQTRAKILVPLLCGDHLWGLLNVTESQHPRQWQPEEVELLQALSAQLAIALQQATTHQQLQEELQERQQAEARLRNSEQHYATLISNLPGYIYRLHNDLNYTPEFISTGVEAITGYSQNEYLVERTISCNQEIHPDDVDEVLEQVQQSIRDRQPYECEYRIITKTGEEKWVWERGRGIYANDGTMTYLEGFVTDITDRKRAETTLLQSEAKGRVILATIPDLMLRIGSDGVFREVVTRCRELDVVPPEINPVGRLMADLLPAAMVSRQFHYVQKALQTGELQVYEQQVLVGDRLQDEEIRVIKSGHDEVLMMIRDISDRKQSERQLQSLIAGTAATTGHDFFLAMVQYIAEALNVSYAIVTEQVGDTLNALAFWANGAPQPTFSYHPAKTPCERTLLDGKFYCPSLVQQQFPDDPDLVYMQAEAYMGIALCDTQGKSIGNLCILNQQPIPNPQWTEDLLRVFAARAVAELERQRAMTLLEKLNADLEERVAQRTTQLREQEAQLQDFFDNANDLIQSVLLEDGRFEYVNRMWRDTLGYSAAEVQTLTLFDILHPSCQPHCREIIIQMQAGKLCTLERVELTFITKNQQAILVEGSINCRLENDRPVATRAIFRDITERKVAEQLLHDREARYRALMDGASDAILVADQHGNLLEVNHKAEELLGYSRAELTSMHFTQLHLPEELSSIAASFEGLVSQPLSHVFNINLLCKDGSIIPVDVSASVIEIHGEKILQGIFRDIRDRKQAEQTIRQQAEQETLLREITQRIRQSLDLQTIFNTACQEIRQLMKADRVGIFQFYPESNFDDGEFLAESSAEGISSIVAVQVHDHCFGSKYAPLYTQGRYAAMDDLYQLEECHTHVLTQFQVRANLVMPLLCGDSLWGLLCIHQCASTRHWQQPEIKLTQQIANQLAIAIQQANLFEQLQRELVDRQQAETNLTNSNQQLAISNQELARATRLKDEFLANMSHELRTPLNAILGMTEGLEEEVFGKLNAKQIKALKTIGRSGSHLLELINDILDVAKIESGQIELDLTPTSVNFLCQSSLAFIKQQALKKRIQIEIKLSPNLPDLLIDERRMRQVLINLLNNAVKFTPEGGHITLKARVQGGFADSDGMTEPSQTFLQIAVIDTGIGIAPEHISKLFQPFIQID